MRSCGELDFETNAISPRPNYPPEPVGVALWPPELRQPRYYAWGHPTGNNCTKAEAVRAVRQLARDHVLVCHHAGFDLDIMETHLGVRWPTTHHDTLLLAFLHDPDSPSLSLKPLGQRHLDEAPTEQDAVRDFILARVAARDPAFRFPDDPVRFGKDAGKWATAKTFGAFIALCPGDLVGVYACGDVRRTRGLRKKLFDGEIKNHAHLRGAYERELKVTPTLIKMERRGVPVDVAKLRTDVRRYGQIKDDVERFLLKKLKVPKRHWDEVLGNYDEQKYFKWSGKGFAEQLLRSGLVDELPQTDKGNDSTSAEALATVMPVKLAHEFEVRSQLATCLQTFMRPWLAQAERTGGFFYARYNQVRNADEWGKSTGARTGRLSMTPNLQNVIRGDKDERVPRLRDYIWRGPYAALGQRDYSQQELRILAHYEDGPFKRSYLENPTQDAHELVRALIRQTTGLEVPRRPTKDLNFGLIYGQGLALTVEKMGKPVNEVKRLRTAHAQSLPGVPVLQRKLTAAAKANEPIYTWGGRRYYCEPGKLIDGRWWSFEYKMLNKLIQGSAADCTKQAMVNYDALGDVAVENPLLLQVHDEVIFGIKRWREARVVHGRVREAMLDVKGLSVPMLSDGKLGRESWHRMEKVTW